MEKKDIGDLPAADQDLIREYVKAQIQNMDAAERRIVQQTELSLAEFITQLTYDLSRIFGYIIAIPVAWLTNVVESIGMGLLDGYKRGYEDQRKKPKRRY